MASTALPRPLLSLLRAGVLLSLTATAAVAQTEYPYAAGTDSTGRAQAVSDAAGRVLIESPEFPRGLWVDLVDEAGQALAGIRVAYEGWPDSLVALRCVDPAGLRQETLLWTRPGDASLQLTLKPDEPAALPAGLTSIDWRIELGAEEYLRPGEEARLMGWEAVAEFLGERWRGQTGRAALQLETGTSIVLEVDRPGAMHSLMTYLRRQQGEYSESLQSSAETSLPLDLQFHAGEFGLLEAVTFLILFEDEELRARVRRWRRGPITRREVAAVKGFSTGWGVRSLAGMEHFAALEKLWVYDGRVSDLSPLRHLTNLQYLGLIKNRVADLGPLASLTNLQTLKLGNNQVADLDALASMTNLQVLQLEHNQITDVSPLASVSNLRDLWLEGNAIEDVGPLASLTNLEELYLEGNHIADVNPLAPLTRLRRLHLDDNQISDVGPLATLVNLPELHLDGNQISDIDPFASLTNLRFLCLGRNRLADVTTLTSLTRLRELNLRKNKITDVGPLVSNTGLDAGVNRKVKVSLEGNPLSERAVEDQIPALKARGVSVHLKGYSGFIYCDNEPE